VANEKSPYAWTTDRDEWRRAFVLELICSAEIDGGVLVKNLGAVTDWLKTGTVPAALAKPHVVKRGLVEVGP